MPRPTSRPQQMFAAMPNTQKVRPMFTVEKLQGTVKHRIHVFDKEKNKIMSKVVDEPAGYLVRFYKGHSIRCRDEAHLKRVGANMQLIPLLDDEGEIKGVMQNIELPDMADDDERDDELIEE
jgi:hypothetical protein